MWNIFGIPDPDLPIHYTTFTGLRWRLRVVYLWASPFCGHALSSLKHPGTAMPACDWLCQYGCELWNLSQAGIERICKSWRVGTRRVCDLPYDCKTFILQILVICWLCMIWFVNDHNDRPAYAWEAILFCLCLFFFCQLTSNLREGSAAPRQKYIRWLSLRFCRKNSLRHFAQPSPNFSGGGA